MIFQALDLNPQDYTLHNHTIWGPKNYTIWGPINREVMLCLLACGHMQIFLRATQTNAPAAHLLYLCLSDTNPQGVMGEDIDHSIVYGGRKQEAD